MKLNHAATSAIKEDWAVCILDIVRYVVFLSLTQGYVTFVISTCETNAAMVSEWEYYVRIRSPGKVLCTQLMNNKYGK